MAMGNISLVQSTLSNNQFLHGTFLFNGIQLFPPPVVGNSIIKHVPSINELIADSHHWNFGDSHR